MLFHFDLAAVQTEQVMDIFQYIMLQYYTVEHFSKSMWCVSVYGYSSVSSADSVTVVQQ